METLLLRRAHVSLVSALVSGGSVVVHHVVHHGGGFYSGSLICRVMEGSAEASGSFVPAQTTRIPRRLRAAA